MAKRLNRDRIIRAATAYIDEHGAEALTMRRIGSYLGVEAMALYRHIGGRDQLLAGVVDSLIDDLFTDPRISSEAHSWEEYVHRVAHTIRDLALDHPKAFPLIATRPPEAPWIRPPLRSLRWVDSFLDALRSHGFSDAQAVYAYKSFTSFLLGALLLETAQRGGDVAEREAAIAAKGPDEDSGATAETPEQYPTVVQLKPLLAEDHGEREFNDALDDLIERLRHPED